MEFSFGRRSTASAASRPIGSIPRTRFWIFFSVLARLGHASAKEKRRMIFRFLRAPHSMRAWFIDLHDICSRSRVDTIPFDLANKPARHFLCNNLRPAQRSHILAYHYDALLNVMGGQHVRDLIAGSHLTLADFVGRSGNHYELRLERSPLWSREGELTCRLLVQNDQVTVATTTFAIGPDQKDGHRCLWIGGLQGSAKHYGKTLTVHVTKDLFGLRPKDLLMHVIYALKESFDAAEIMTASNLGHASSRVYRARKWVADYDRYWIELGATPNGPYAFKLPAQLRRRSIDEVTPTKRGAWRARHVLLDKIVEDVRVMQRQYRKASVSCDTGDNG
ncbi:DUF535 family protein [Undibacter mobilis]|uniref:DUF535 domain-containing protein n=1 Tax=Undibacter mobilis TaxID=2292256 RepID=A0A371BAM5_9BRAD|nr:DUF535 family protein [Undibacter mobilis]RDV04592.1 DUF535 domain-containing protein [Undibacter mobilis]